MEHEKIDNLYYYQVRELPDIAERVNYMKKFANAGDPAAQCELGMLYVFGEDGVERNWGVAKDLFRKAAVGGVSNAMAFLSMICMEQMSDILEEALSKDEPEEKYRPKVIPYFDEAAKNLACALTYCNELAFRIYTGNMKKVWNQGEFGAAFLKRTNLALQPYMEELKRKNDGRSNYVLGIFCLRGIGGLQNIERARNYFLKGAELGDYSSKQELKNPLFMLDDDE